MELSSNLSTLSILTIGFVLGLRHAIEADHLAAVSTIVAQRKSLFAASIVGGFWGIGHTISLFVVGLVVIFLKLQISESLESRLEAVVGAMLVVLGANALLKLRKAESVHVHKHTHGNREHIHVHTHTENAENTSHHRFSPRSILVGMIHGLAGSGALMFLILPVIPSKGVALAYILVFGIGSIGGMMAMSFFMGLPFYFTANSFDFLNKGIRLVAGLFSSILGAYIIYERLFAV